MIKRSGIAAIAILIFGFVVLHFGFSQAEAGPRATGASFIGGVAFLLMTVSIILATRVRFLEDAFGGLDRMYQVHKMCGVASGLLVLLHFFASPKGPIAGLVTQADLIPSAPLGMLSMIGLVISLAITLNRKISYSKWRLPHKAMGIVYILINIHIMKTPTALFDNFGPSGIMIIVMGALGLIAYFYSMFGMNRATARAYVIETVNTLERATEVILRPKHGKMQHRAGQFAFIEVQGPKLNEPHPFTISSAPSDEYLKFTIKVLGDWTRKVREDIRPGTDVIVRGPYGRFCPENAGDKQVWLAGGIGITPFLSAIRDLKPNDTREIYLVYGVREESDALFAEELRTAMSKHKNMKLILLESNNGEFARVEVMKEKLAGKLNEFDYFLCGPSAMVKGIGSNLKAEGVSKSQIHTEAFEFR